MKITSAILSTLFVAGIHADNLRGTTDRNLRTVEQVCNNGSGGIGIEMFNIKIFDNPFGSEHEYMSANNRGPGQKPTIDRAEIDDNSGRQKWRLIAVPDRPDVYEIVIAGGIDNRDFVYLSYPGDDGFDPSNSFTPELTNRVVSDRQRWIVTPREGGEEGEMWIQSARETYRFTVTPGASPFQAPYLDAITRTSNTPTGLQLLHRVDVRFYDDIERLRPRSWRLVPTGCNPNDITQVVTIDFTPTAPTGDNDNEELTPPGNDRTPPGTLPTVDDLELQPIALVPLDPLTLDDLDEIAQGGSILP